MKWKYNNTGKSKHRICHCDSSFTNSSCGRMIYVYPEQNIRAYPGEISGIEEWDSIYKIRVNVEKSISYFKDSFSVVVHKIQNKETLHSDLFLAESTLLITPMVADKLNIHQSIRSSKPLIA